MNLHSLYLHRTNLSSPLESIFISRKQTSATSTMDSRRNPDLISTLEDFLLVLIISLLPFKEAVRTSGISRRWRNLYLQSTNIAFRESEFMKFSVYDNEDVRRDARVSFVQYMVTWVTRFSGESIETLEICLARPVGFEGEIRRVVEFAVSKGVKNLVLDFSDHSWSTTNEAKAEPNAFQLPECVYTSADLVSLKLFFCGFNPSRYANPGSLKSLSFGWTQLRTIMALIANCPLLESLSMANCWNVGLDTITGDNNRLRELIYKNCEFTEAFSTLDLPSIQTFKYSGTVHYFQFMAVNRNMKEAELDFEAESEYDEETGTQLAGLLYDLLSAKKLTVCPFLLQVIQESEDPVKLPAPMETKHLVLKTNMQRNEFVGIRLMINSCPELETLTFVMVPPRSVMPIPLGTRVESYWTVPIKHPCMKKTLKYVEVQEFRGSIYEVQVLQYLIEQCSVLQRMDLYAAVRLNSSEMRVARAAANLLGRNCQRGSDALRIFIYDP